MQSNKQYEQMREEASRDIQNALGVVAMIHQVAAAGDGGKVTLPGAELEYATRAAMDALNRAQESLDAMKEEPEQPAIHAVA